MTKKKLIALFSILFVIVLFVFCMAFFTLQHVSVFFIHPTNKAFDHTGIIESAEFDYGRSLVSQDKQQYIANIEKANPYIKVNKIETKFPNRMIIHVEERQPMYVLHNVTAGQYLVLDEQMKVLEIITDEDYMLLTDQKPMELVVENYSIVFDQLGEGVVAQLSSTNELLDQFYISMIEYGYDLTALKAMIKTITYNNLTNQMYIETYYGVNLLLDTIDTLFDEKLGVAFGGYEQLKQVNTTNAVVVVTEVEGEVVYEVKTK